MSTCLPFFPIDCLLTFNRLASEVGWRYGDVVKRLEAKRKQKGSHQLERLQRFRKFRLQAQVESKKALTEAQSSALAAVRVNPTGTNRV